jgi:hypothetical protein
MAKDELEKRIKRGEAARLFPVVADSKREERVTAVVLAAFSVVPAFAQAMLRKVGANVGARSRIKCLTEVVFDIPGTEKLPRPDGLIIVQSPKSTWGCIVEAKAGNANLDRGQIEAYLDVAKTVGADAVLTISNEFAAVPTHHPVSVSKQKTRSVDLFHFSWVSLLTEAVLLCETKVANDPEQAFILSELIRYLRHDSSGVSSLTRMGKGWGQVCGDIQQGVSLRSSGEAVSDTVASWQELCRFLALDLTSAIGAPVRCRMNKKELADPLLHVARNTGDLVDRSCLTAELEIPNAASPMSVTADFRRRTLDISMSLNVPRDKKRAKSCITWALRQLDSEIDGAERIVIKVQWPRRTPDTSATLQQAIEDPSILLAPNAKELPSRFEIIAVRDLAGRFRGAKTFVEEVTTAVPDFYKKIGQHLSPWVPAPPKVKSTSTNSSETSPPKVAGDQEEASSATPSGLFEALLHKGYQDAGK